MSMPQMPKSDFANVFIGANPLGKTCKNTISSAQIIVEIMQGPIIYSSFLNFLKGQIKR